MKAKRAMEHPQEVIRMLFIAIIIIFNIVIIYNLMSDLDITATYKVNNLKYNAITARILYSSDCYALKESYDLNGTVRYQVHAGVLDLDKLNEGHRLNKCISNAQYESKITYGEDAYEEKTGECKGWEREENILILINDGGEVKDGEAKIKVCVL